MASVTVPQFRTYIVSPADSVTEEPQPETVDMLSVRSAHRVTKSTFWHDDLFP